MLVLCSKLFICLLYPVSDSMESIEKDYVLVNAHFASTEGFSFYLDTSLHDKSSSALSLCPSRKKDGDIAVAIQSMELAGTSVGGPESAEIHRSDLLVTSSSTSMLREAQRLTILHPSTRLHLLHQYVLALADLSQEKVCYLMLLALTDMVIVSQSDYSTKLIHETYLYI